MIRIIYAVQVGATPDDHTDRSSLVDLLGRMPQTRVNRSEMEAGCWDHGREMEVWDLAGIRTIRRDMSIVAEERRSDSPYVEAVTYGRTESDGSAVRPAECRWHLVVVRQAGCARALAVGPLTGAGVASWGAGAEILWIRFALGTFMPQMPARNLLDTETPLPDATSKSFWLGGSAWPFPDRENAEAFVERLVREGVLARDPVVGAGSTGSPPQGLSPRTLRHRFLRATGLAQGAVRQVERANRAAARLRRGVPIPDVVHDEGYFDQAHMTRSLKRRVGRTPARIATARGPD